jgi:hypothetical protein
VDACIRLADRDEPWWRTFPGWFWQVDLERWPNDSVPASVGIDFARQLRARTGRWTILYASKGQYGDSLGGWDGPLWNANYGANPTGGFQAVYPGDGSSRWGAYSGKVPTFLQYGSNATIAGLSTCDANAFRGSVGQLRALIEGANMDEIERKAGNADLQANAILRDADDVTIKLANGTDFKVTNQAKANRLKAIADLKAATGQSTATPAPVALTDAQVAALGDQVGVAVVESLAELTAAVVALTERLAAAGHALADPAG